jgi:two-component system chemotaxis response regulator CheY
LIVDDDDMIRSYLSIILRQAGHTIAGEVGDVQKAQKVLSRVPVSVLFLDINLPGVDGLTALKDLRAAYPATQIVMLSGESTAQNVKTAIAEGAISFVTKPFTADKVIQSVRKALAVRR